ncbi:MAG: permease-like cell division protein FtsX [Oscillospiraceae bacterium]|nr:permease-like cell division protein FtsX [Oscillospiraceae bacterium]
MKRNNFGYYIREGNKGIFVHGFMSFAAICAIIACLLIMGSFVLITLNLNNIISDLERESEILVYIDDNLSEAEAKSVGSNINMITNVQQAVFVSRDEALQDYIGQQDDPTLFDGVDATTLRDRYRVTLLDIGQTKDTVTKIEAISGVAKVSAHYEISNGFMTMQSILNVASTAIIAILMIVSLFIISNTVKLALYDRREEIAIMRMVGATNRFIRGPFLIEGFTLGIVGAAIAFFAEWGVYSLITVRIQAVDTMKLLNLLPFMDIWAPMAAGFAAVGFVVGVIGSALSIRKFLRV